MYDFSVYPRIPSSNISVYRGYPNNYPPLKDEPGAQNLKMCSAVIVAKSISGKFECGSYWGKIIQILALGSYCGKS